MVQRRGVRRAYIKTAFVKVNEILRISLQIAEWWTKRELSVGRDLLGLVIEHLPSRDAWFFRADTHDEHVAVAPTDPDYPAFQALTAHNRAVAAAIESAWTLDGLDTFRAFLRRDLESRRP